MRLFVGVWPTPAVVAGLEEARAQLRARVPRGVLRWTPLEQCHVTLRFLGEVDSGRVSALSDALRAAVADVPRFSLQLGALGCFPSVERPRVIWLGVDGDRESLRVLQGLVASACAGVAEREEDHAFSPHLTLARVRDGAPAERRALREALETLGLGHAKPPLRRQPEGGSWDVDVVKLARSELSPAGAVYSTVAEIPLAMAR